MINRTNKNTNQKTFLVQRVFYIDVSKVLQNEVGNYMDAVKAKLQLLNKDNDDTSVISKLRQQGLYSEYFIPIIGQSRVELQSVEIE